MTSSDPAPETDPSDGAPADREPGTARKNRVLRELDKQSERHAKGRNFLLPSPDATTNLLIADIVVRSASTLFRKNVERRVARASRSNRQEAEDLLKGRSMLKTLALYSASKIATRSPLGLGLVVGGLAIKTLYDVGKAREDAERASIKVTKSKDPSEKSDEGA